MSVEVGDMIRTLADARRRIDNMRHILAEKEALRDRTVEAIRRTLGRTTVETAPVTLRVDPGDARACAISGRAIAARTPGATIRVVSRAGETRMMAAGDALLFDQEALDLPEGWSDAGSRLVSSAAATKLGAGWTLPENRNGRTR